MGIFPTVYSKGGFIEFLQKNHINETIIDKTKILPESVKKNNHLYKINILCTWYNTGDTHYNFELNYYSEDQIEYLFPFKVFTNVETSIDNLICDLVDGKFIVKPKICKPCK
jgi:hypothetical protein